MEQHGTRLLHLAYLYVRDRQLAEDVTQEVFIKAYQAMGEFRGESAVYTWLYRIAVNLCRDRLRAAYHRHTFLPGDLPASADVAEGPEDLAVQDSQRQHLLRHVLELPDHYREALVLYYYQDLSTAEMAQWLGEPEGTVKTRLHRGRRLLQERLLRGEVAP